MILKIQKLHPDAKIPSYAHPGDAGMDVYAIGRHAIAPGERVLVPTGIAMALPAGTVALVWDKSGIAIKKGIKTLGGVIDEGYRGEVMIGLVNLSKEEYVIEPGDKIAQVLIQHVQRPAIEAADRLDETSRGNGAFGSTGNS